MVFVHKNRCQGWVTICFFLLIVSADLVLAEGTGDRYIFEIENVEYIGDDTLSLTYVVEALDIAPFIVGGTWVGPSSERRSSVLFVYRFNCLIWDLTEGNAHSLIQFDTGPTEQDFLVVANGSSRSFVTVQISAADLMEESQIGSGFVAGSHQLKVVIELPAVKIDCETHEFVSAEKVISSGPIRIRVSEGRLHYMGAGF